MVAYNNAHRLFLQVITSSKILSEDETQKLYLKTGEQMQVDTPADELNNFLTVINKNLEPLYLAVRRGQAEESGLAYYALVNCYEDEHSKLATDFSPSEIEFVKKVMEVIIMTEDGVVSSIDLINVGRDLTKRISTQAAEDLLERLTVDKWLTEVRGKISFGPRAVIELGQYLKNKFKDQISECKLCHHFVISGDLCLSCGVKIHKFCAAINFKSVPSSKRKCPNCKEQWDNDIIKLPQTADIGNASTQQSANNVEVSSSSSSITSSRRSKRR